jgi:hypothetical protein
MIELQLENPPHPRSFQVDGITYWIDAEAADLVEDQDIILEEGILYIRLRKSYSKANAFSISQRCYRQRLDVYLYEAMNGQGRSINMHTHRLIFADGNPYNLQMHNIRIDRLPLKLVGGRRRIA